MFDQQKADRVINFIQKCCIIPSGEGVGGPFVLEDWQRDEIVTPLFGNIREDGTRQYRKAYLSFARRNGKSTICSVLALYMLYADGEISGNVTICANSTKQASEIFESCDRIINASPILKKRTRTTPHAKRIVDMKTGSKLRVVAADPRTLVGQNNSTVIMDELAFARNDKAYWALATSMGSRKQPLFIVITTASEHLQSPAKKYLYDLAKDIEGGKRKDDSFFYKIYEADPKDDWQSPETWKKANPALGKFRSLSDMAELCETAKHSPEALHEFKKFFLNMWVQHKEAWIPVERWKACSDQIDRNKLNGSKVFVGLDLSVKHDLTSISLWFPMDNGHYATFSDFFLPEDNIREKEHRDGVPYSQWASSGHLRLTPGESVDYEIVRQRLLEIKDKYDVQELVMDRYNSDYFDQRLTNDGFTLVPFAQNFTRMSEPCREFYDLILRKRLHHDNNPILNWMAENVALVSGPGNTVMPTKQDGKKSPKRIDGIVSTVIALGREMLHRSTPTDLVWALS